MKAKGKRTVIPLSHPMAAVPLRIISESAMATKGFADGRLIPALIVDAASRADVRELFHVQEYIPVGDVTTQWGGARRRSEDFMLIITFKNPVVVTVIIEFQMPKQKVLVDQILRSRALYLQLGKDGDVLATTMNEKRIGIEVLGEFPQWPEIMSELVLQDFLAMGMTRADAKRAAEKHSAEWQGFANYRLKD